MLIDCSLVRRPESCRPRVLANDQPAIQLRQLTISAGNASQSNPFTRKNENVSTAGHLAHRGSGQPNTRTTAAPVGPLLGVPASVIWFRLSMPMLLHSSPIS
jgi:hypothetical protein